MMVVLKTSGSRMQPASSRDNDGKSKSFRVTCSQRLPAAATCASAASSFRVSGGGDERCLPQQLGHTTPIALAVRGQVDELVKVDIRRQQLIVSGQEVLTSDRVPLKVSLVAEYSVTDVTKAVTEVEELRDTLYSRLQPALRETVAARGLDEALAERGEISTAILQLASEESESFGVLLRSVQVRDFMMGAGLRGAYSDVIQARQQGLAALERARGESAALRNLANSAEILERNPGIAHLRLLQAVEGSSGHRIVIALDPERGRRTTLDVTAEGEV